MIKFHLPIILAFSLQGLISFLNVEIHAANCSAIVCHNGGTCNNFTASPPCICPLPYIAPYCEAAVDYCNTLQPDKGITEFPVCLNGGNCTKIFSDPYFNCTCTSGYSGVRCASSQKWQEASSFFSCLYDCDIGLTTTSKVVIGVCVPLIVVIIVCALIYISTTDENEQVSSDLKEDQASLKPRMKMLKCKRSRCCSC